MGFGIHIGQNHQQALTSIVVSSSGRSSQYQNLHSIKTEHIVVIVTTRPCQELASKSICCLIAATGVLAHIVVFQTSRVLWPNPVCALASWSGNSPSAVLLSKRILLSALPRNSLAISPGSGLVSNPLFAARPLSSCLADHSLGTILCESPKPQLLPFPLPEPNKNILQIPTLESIMNHQHLCQLPSAILLHRLLQCHLTVAALAQTNMWLWCHIFKKKECEVRKKRRIEVTAEAFQMQKLPQQVPLEEKTSNPAGCSSFNCDRQADQRTCLPWLSVY